MIQVEIYFGSLIIFLEVNNVRLSTLTLHETFNCRCCNEAKVIS